MSLRKFRKATLLDKHEEERLRLEAADSKVQKVIKKSSKKKNK